MKCHIESRVYREMCPTTHYHLHFTPVVGTLKCYMYLSFNMIWELLSDLPWAPALGIDGYVGWTILEPLDEKHGPPAEVQAAMETVAACLMLLEDFKEHVLGYSSPYRAAWSNLTCNASKGDICLSFRCLWYLTTLPLWRNLRTSTDSLFALPALLCCVLSVVQHFINNHWSQWTLAQLFTSLEIRSSLIQFTLGLLHWFHQDT